MLCADPASAPVVHDVPVPVRPAAFPGRPESVVAQGPVLIFEPLRLFVAALANAERLERSAGVATVRRADYPFASADFFPAVIPDPVATARALFARPAPDHAAAPWHHAAGNDNSVGEFRAAARPGDSGHPKIFSGRPVAVPVLERNGDSTGPNRADAAPNHYPSDFPSAAVLLAATRENRLEDSGSSAPGRAG